jgi:hypothetical protein
MNTRKLKNQHWQGFWVSLDNDCFKNSLIIKGYSDSSNSLSKPLDNEFRAGASSSEVGFR